MTEEENNKKQCPFCGAEINANAKKCRFCNNWIDDEIECPFCAEKIKASAKKCRFCGEWLPDKQEQEEDKNESPKKSVKSDKPAFDFKSIINKKIFLYSSIGAAVLLLILIFVVARFYVPRCGSGTIIKHLKENLVLKYPSMGEININHKAVSVVKKNEKGYTCSTSATIDNVPTRIEYKYQKVSMNDYNYDVKIVLPNCFDADVKKLLAETIKDVDYLDIKKIASDVTTSYETVVKYDKNAPSYQCSADTEIVAKPGKAFKMSYWDYDDATRQIKCRVDYKTYLCENGFTT